MSTEEQATPEGALIRLARKARGLSVKKAVELLRDRAPDIRLGESRWYHIEGGTEGKGKPVIAPDDTYAHMAYIVGLTPDRLEEVGREDAAEILTEIILQEAMRSDPTTKSARPEQPDPQLRRIIEAWPRLHQFQRNALTGVLETFLREPADMAGKPATTEERRAG